MLVVEESYYLKSRFGGMRNGNPSIDDLPKNHKSQMPQKLFFIELLNLTLGLYIESPGVSRSRTNS